MDTCQGAQVTAADRDDAEEEFRNRVVGLVEHTSIHVAGVAPHVEEIAKGMAWLEETFAKRIPGFFQIWHADYRRGNNVLAHRLDRVMQLLEAQLLHSGAEVPPVLPQSSRFACSEAPGELSVKQFLFPPVPASVGPPVDLDVPVVDALVEPEPDHEEAPYSPAK